MMVKNKDVKLERLNPDGVVEKLNNWFDPCKKFVFVFTLLLGVITHLLVITGTIFSQDGLWNSMSYFVPGDWEITLGRWGLEIAGKLTNYMAIPNLTSIFCLIVSAVIAVLIIDLFEIKNKFIAGLVGAVFAVSPILTVTLLYVYTSFAYILNFLLSTLATFFIFRIKNKKLGVAVSAIFFMFSLSIYQSYIGVTVGLGLMIGVLRLARGENKPKEVFIDLVRLAISIVIGGILYYIVTLVVLNVYSLELADYTKANAFSLFSIIKSIPNGIRHSYKDFMAFSFRDRIISNTNYRREYIFGFFYLAVVLNILYRLIKGDFEEEKKEKVIRKTFMVALLILIPLGLNVVDLLVADNELYALSSAQMILMIPFGLALFDNLNLPIEKWIIYISTVMIIITYFIAAQVSYESLKLTYNQVYSAALRLQDRVENTPEYEPGMPYVFAGIIGDNNFPRNNRLYEYTLGSMVTNAAFHYSYYGMTGTWINYYRIFFGMDINVADEVTYTNIISGDIYQKEMDVFPAQNSVRVIDGCIVIKLDKTPPVPF